ncbi:MAG: hypothetical protein M3198_15940, partial [Actinomycetota bacterium]|nr:hypothetical protein [Actinomycetota bacterium]
TELLGLELFGRMAQRSNEIARDARSAVEANERVVEAEYARIDEDAVQRARDEAKGLEAAAARASEAEATLEQLEDEWAEQTDSAEVLEDLAAEIADRRSSYGTHATTLERQARDLKGATEAAQAARRRLDSLREESDLVAAERSRLEETEGTLEDLATLRSNVESLRALEREVKKAQKTALEQKSIHEKAKKDLERHDEAVRAADSELTDAQNELDVRETEHEHARRADLVGALTHSLHAGDPCPICDRPLETLPTSDASDVKEAAEARAAAQKRARLAQEAASSRRVAQARGAEAVEATARRCSECATEAELKKEQLEDARSQIEDRISGDPEQQLKEIARRVAALKDLLAAEKKAAAAYSSATQEVSTQQETLSEITTKIATVRGAIEGAPIKPLLVKVKRALGRARKISFPAELPEAPQELAGVVRRVSEQLEAVEVDLTEEVRARREQASALVQKARDMLPDGVDVDGGGIKLMLQGLRGACRALSRQAVLAAEEAKNVEKKLATKRELAAAIAVRRQEQTVYAQLHRELKNDRIVQFLQAEALGLLAAAAGEHLRELSDGRYDLVFEDDRFYVIDAWNGNEQRSVRTLSGGETFLASLGLALALSEQVQLLAVTERARLQSLFLDEGFGTLDAETLDVVVGAISRLGSDGRLVGVITHVAELAEAMPVRIQVRKGPRGSLIEMEQAEALAP